MGMRFRWAAILLVALGACSSGSPAAGSAERCDSFVAADVRRWFAWDIAGEVTGSADACHLEFGSGSSMTVVVGSPAAITKQLLDATVPTDYLHDADLTVAGTGGEQFRPGLTLAVRSDGVTAMIARIEPPTAATTDFTNAGPLLAVLLQRLHPVDEAARTVAIAGIKAAPQQCGLSFDGVNDEGTAALSLAPPLDSVAAGSTLTGTATIGVDATGSVSFGSNLGGDRCTDLAPDPQPEHAALWPIVAGTLTFEVAPSSDGSIRCHMVAVVSGTDLVAERSDGSTVELADITVRNDGYGDFNIDGCIFPADLAA